VDSGPWDSEVSSMKGVLRKAAGGRVWFAVQEVNANKLKSGRPGV